MLQRCLFLICFSLFSANVSAEELCPNIDTLPPPSGADELKMLEKQFTFKHAMESIQYLEKDVIEMLKKHKGSYSILDFEGFYIGYPNSISFLKGTLLKQEALIAKNRLELMKLKSSKNTATKKKIDEAKKIYTESRKKFCDFLKNTEYVD